MNFAASGENISVALETIVKVVRLAKSCMALMLCTACIYCPSSQPSNRNAGFLWKDSHASPLRSAKLALVLGTGDKRSLFLVLKKY